MLRLFIWHKFKKILTNWSVMFFHSYLSNVYGILDILRLRFFKAKMFILNEVFHACTANLTRKILFEVVLWDPNHESFCNDVSLKEISKVVWTIKIATRLKSSWTTFKNYRSSKSVDKRFCIYYLTVQFMNAC